jgi:hypothetical protein
LRNTLGLLPILFVGRYLILAGQVEGDGIDDRMGRALLVACGFCVGISLFYSQDAGAACGFSCAVTMIVVRIGAGGFRLLVKEALWMAAGFAICVVPLLAWLQYHNALGPAAAVMMEAVQDFAMGYGGIPYPSFFVAITRPFDGNYLYSFWAIIIYGIAAVHCATGLYSGRRDPRLYLELGLLLFGAVLFRSALGRSDSPHVHFGSMPAFMILFAWWDDWACRFSDMRMHEKRMVIVTNAVIAAALVIILSSNYLVSGYASSVRNAMLTPSAKFPGYAVPGEQVVGLDRAGVHFESKTTESLAAIQAFLDANVSPGEPVYCFPNQPMYFFLFDITNPTRSTCASLTHTRRHRILAIEDLEKHPTRYIIYNDGAPRMDRIPTRVMYRELYDYIREAYEPAIDLGHGVVIWQRKEK